MSFLFEKARGSIQVFLVQNKPQGLLFARDAAIILGAVCVAVSSYGVSKIASKREVGTPVSICQRIGAYPEVSTQSTDADARIKDAPESVLTPSVGLENTDTLPGAGGRVVASKNGSKYHYPWCPGAGQINEENKVWYENESQAQNAGLTKAKNCQ